MLLNFNLQEPVLLDYVVFPQLVQNFADFFMSKPHFGHDMPLGFASEMPFGGRFFATKNEESERGCDDDSSITVDVGAIFDGSFLSMVFFISNIDFIARNSNAEYFSTESIIAEKYSRSVIFPSL